MQTTIRKSVDRNKSKDNSKDELLLSSKKSKEEKPARSTPRNFIQKTTTADIYGKKKNIVTQAPKKVASSANVTSNASPMKDFLKSSPSSTNQLSSRSRTSKHSNEDKVETKSRLSITRKTTPRVTKEQFTNVTINSPIVKRKESVNKKTDVSKGDNSKRAINLLQSKSNDVSKGDNSKRAINVLQSKSNDNSKNADIYLRQRSKTRTLDEDEVKVLKPELVDNNREMQNLSRKLSARPKAFFVDFNEDQPKKQIKIEKEKSSEEEEEEVSYEDDFESYESDFDSYHSETKSENSSSGDDQKSDKEHNDEVEDNFDTETGEDSNAKYIKYEEKMLDSGSFDLRDSQRTAHKVKPFALDFILEGSEDCDKKPSLTDEGFQDMSSSSAVSSMKTIHVDILDRPLFIDFTKSTDERRNRRKRRIFQRLQQRAKDILSMVTLHEMSYALFEMKPIPYDLYMATFGRHNYTQISVQTFEDAISNEVQTDDIDYSNKWTQFPIKFSKNRVHLNDEMKEDKNNDDFFGILTNLVNREREDRNEKYNDADYKANPLRIFFEQKDGVGSDQMLPYNTYKNRLKQNYFNVNRLKKFLKKVEGRISKILSINAGSPDLVNLVRSTNISLSQGYVSIPINSLTDSTLRQNMKVTNLVISENKQNLLFTVHQTISATYDMKKCVFCLWDVSVAIQKPIKTLITSEGFIKGRFRGNTDGILVAALNDGSLHLWDLSETATWSHNVTSDEKSTNSVENHSSGLTQTEIEREWNFQSSLESTDKKNVQTAMQICAYTTSGTNLLNGEVVDCVVGLEFVPDSHATVTQDGGRKIVAQICSLQRIGNMTIWSIIQEKTNNSKDIGKAFWASMKLEKIQTIVLAEYLDINIGDVANINLRETFNLNAAKRRILNRRQERNSLKQSFNRPKSAREFGIDRAKSATCKKQKSVLPTTNSVPIFLENGIDCTDLKIMKFNNIDNYLIAKNCGEVLCCTRAAGMFKVNRLIVTNDTSAITCLEISTRGLPYVIACTESGTLNVCSLIDCRVLLTLDCRNGPPIPTETCKADHKGRYIGSVKVESSDSIVFDRQLLTKTSIKSVVWSQSNPFDILALLRDGTLSVWQLTSSDIYARRIDNAAVVCATSSDTLAIVTPHNEVHVHRLAKEDQDRDFFQLFQKYLTLL